MTEKQLQKAMSVFRRQKDFEILMEATDNTNKIVAFKTLKGLKNRDGFIDPYSKEEYYTFPLISNPLDSEELSILIHEWATKKFEECVNELKSL